MLAWVPVDPRGLYRRREAEYSMQRRIMDLWTPNPSESWTYGPLILPRVEQHICCFAHIIGTQYLASPSAETPSSIH